MWGESESGGDFPASDMVVYWRGAFIFDPSDGEVKGFCQIPVVKNIPSYDIFTYIWLDFMVNLASHTLSISVWYVQWWHFDNLKPLAKSRSEERYLECSLGICTIVVNVAMQWCPWCPSCSWGFIQALVASCGVAHRDIDDTHVMFTIAVAVVFAVAWSFTLIHESRWRIVMYPMNFLAVTDDICLLWKTNRSFGEGCWWISYQLQQALSCERPVQLAFYFLWKMVKNPRNLT